MGFWVDEAVDRAYMELSEMQDTIQSTWRSGHHRDQTGKLWKITEMSDDHLLNTANYFRGKTINMFDVLDISPLEEEIKNRQLNY